MQREKYSFYNLPIRAQVIAKNIVLSIGHKNNIHYGTQKLFQTINAEG